MSEEEMPHWLKYRRAIKPKALNLKPKNPEESWVETENSWKPKGQQAYC